MPRSQRIFETIVLGCVIPPPEWIWATGRLLAQQQVSFAGSSGGIRGLVLLRDRGINMLTNRQVYEMELRLYKFIAKFMVTPSQLTQMSSANFKTIADW